jgi:hypothetical protein
MAALFLRTGNPFSFARFYLFKLSFADLTVMHILWLVRIAVATLTPSFPSALIPRSHLRCRCRRFSSQPGAAATAPETL